MNIGQAHIAGFEMELSKAFRGFDVAVNYTFLDGVNEDEDRPLDLVPKSQLNFVLNVRGPGTSKFSFSGIYASTAEIQIFDDIVKVPGYFVLGAVFSMKISDVDIFLKGENLLDNDYATEPGYPMKARAVAIGFRYNLQK